MGKKKIDKLKLIEDKLHRNVAFCKRKRGFLKKAIELSQLCAQNILIIIHDPDKGRVIQYSSKDAFGISQAYSAIKEAKDQKNINKNNYEKFTNLDYHKLEMLDFRSIRYKKDEIYNSSFDKISELEVKPKQSKIISIEMDEITLPKDAEDESPSVSQSLASSHKIEPKKKVFFVSHEKIALTPDSFKRDTSETKPLP